MIDLSAADGALVRRAGVCVVGAGVAGQTVARRLAAHGVDVALVESGGLDFDRQVQDLAAGPNIGFEYYPLVDSRLRLFGGTTAIWGGRCVALDPVDFERRPWVPHSGWPIGYDDLEPYVDEAFAALELKRPRSWSDLGLERPPLDPAKIDVPLWSFDERSERFTNVKDLSDPRIETVLNATLTEIRLGSGGEIAALRFQSLNGREMTVSAAAYVIAAGGIETARLLLAAAPDRPKGLGNGADLVGRFFMEHPHARAGRLFPAAETDEAWRALVSLAQNKLRVDGRRYAAAYRPTEAVQRELGVLNSVVSLAIRRHEGQPLPKTQRAISFMKHELPSAKIFRRIYHTGKRWVTNALPSANSRSGVRWLSTNGGKEGLYAVVRAEQAPNPDSRVTLADERDALGVRRAALDWRLTALDRISIAGLVATLDDALRGAGLGRIEPTSWLSDESLTWRIDPVISAHHIGGYHHIGTTRMGATPREGVVDADCRLFETPNLYIAGSSVFPTAGWANPTITIMALAMRLGDKLAGEVGAAR